MHLWRIAYNFLPTKDKLSEFSLSSDPSCPLCNVGTESALHLFTHCHTARAIWFGSCWNIRIDRWQVQSQSHLIELLIDPPPSLQLDKEQRNEFLLFGALTLVTIWMWRNKAINERFLLVEGQVNRCIHKCFLEHWRPKLPVLTSAPTRNSARWSCPSQGMLKLNCDAAIGDLSSCIVIVARDWRGKLVFATSKKVNTNIPIQAEADAILLAVHIALNFSFCNCIIKSDCKVCIDAIRASGKLIPWRILNFVDSVKNVISDYGHLFFNWVHREANQAAHVLAKWSLSQSFFRFF